MLAVLFGNPWHRTAAGQDASSVALSAIAAAHVDKPSGDTMRRLSRLDLLIGRQAWQDVADAADDLASAPLGGWIQIEHRLYCGVREAVQRKLASVPDDGLTLYRRQNDAIAMDWFKRGVEQRDESLLRRIIDQAFCSSPGDDALWALGEIALERGDYLAARTYWARVHSQTAGRQLAYPDSSIPLAEARARLALVSIREGDWERAKRDIELLLREHPDARGRLGGKHVALAKWLQDELQRQRDIRRPRAVATDWPTLFGDPARRNVSRVDLEQLTAFEQVWSVRIASPMQAMGPARICDLPVVADGIVYFQDGAAIHAVRLTDGVSASETGRELVELGKDETEVGPLNLCIADGKLLAVAPEARRLIALDLSRDAAIILDQRATRDGVTFVGHPVLEGDRVVVFESGRGTGVTAAIVCYDLWSGKQLWKRSLGWAIDHWNAESPRRYEAELSATGGVIFVNTGIGMVAAVRAADGEPLWLYAYDRVDRTRLAAPNPCRAAYSQVFVAPGDSASTMAIDAASGGLDWVRTHPSPDVQLLAVDDHNVFLQGERLSRLSRADGTLDADWGSDVGAIAGQGVVAGRLILWPSTLAVHEIDRRTGAPTTQSLPLTAPGGANLAVVESVGEDERHTVCVIMAGSSFITVFHR